MAALAEYLIGIIILLLFAIFAFKRDALTEEGTLVAIIIGLLVFIFPASPIAGRIWFTLLAVFFVTSFIVTKFNATSKEAVNREFAKGATRDLMQVFANGAGAALFAVIYYFYPSNAIFVAFAVVLATVNADTWATELGVLSKHRPILITTLKPVERGTSGAVSVVGLAASLVGALFIALSSVFLLFLNSSYTHVFVPIPGGVLGFILLVTVFGVIGSLIDSWFGATLQIMYYCKKCKKETERTVHTCGEKTTYFKGLKFFDNDVVNLASSLIAGAIAWGVFTILF